jgi:hypothetical protein
LGRRLRSLRCCGPRPSPTASGSTLYRRTSRIHLRGIMRNHEKSRGIKKNIR